VDNDDDGGSVEPMDSDFDDYHKLLYCMEKLSNQMKVLERTSAYNAAEKSARTRVLKKQLDACCSQLELAYE
jgi:hypothetical protein